MSDERLIVASDIPFGSAHAYRRGDTILQDAVDANDWQDYVVAADSKEGRAAQGLPEEEETPAPEQAPVQTEAAAPPQPKTTTTTAAGGKDK